jgi:hypothetical protein
MNKGYWPKQINLWLQNLDEAIVPLEIPVVRTLYGLYIVSMAILIWGLTDSLRYGVPSEVKDVSGNEEYVGENFDFWYGNPDRYLFSGAFKIALTAACLIFMYSWMRRWILRSYPYTQRRAMSAMLMQIFLIYTACDYTMRSIWDYLLSFGIVQ